MVTISRERLTELWDQLIRVGKASPPEPEAFARLGLEIIDAHRDLTNIEQGDVVSDILVHCRSDEAHDAFMQALEARNLA